MHSGFILNFIICIAKWVGKLFQTDSHIRSTIKSMLWKFTAINLSKNIIKGKV